MAKSFGLPFCLAAVLKLIHDICQFVGPIMLSRITDFLEDTDPSLPKVDFVHCSDIIESWLHVWCHYVCCRFDPESLSSELLLSLFPNWFTSSIFLCDYGVNVCYMFHSRYNKSLRLSTASRAQYSQGEIMNLMEVDSQKFQDITSYLQTIWSGPFQIIGSLILPWQQLNWATLSGVAVMIVMIPFTRFISRKLAGIQRELMKVKDDRINTTSEALEGIKLIKLQAWERSFLQRIGGIRTNELSVLRR